MNSHYILINVELKTSLEPIASISMVIPTTNISEIYEKCFSLWGIRMLGRKINWNIIETIKPTYIMSRGVPIPYHRNSIRPCEWEIHLSPKLSGTEVTISLVKNEGLLGNSNQNTPDYYFQFSEYFFKKMGLEITKDVQRKLYSLEFLQRTIRRSTSNLVLSTVGFLFLLGYGYYVEFVLGNWGEFLSYMMFAMFPFFYMLAHLEIVVEYRTLRQRLYLTL